MKLLWVLFFLICLGLGYPTLNRYDPPQEEGTSDAQHYYAMVVSGPKDALGHWRYRILVPFLAKPVYWLADKKLGSWNSVSVGMLTVNAAFSATSAFLLVKIGLKIFSRFSPALLGALLFLLNFTVPNYHLSGLVDAAEGCFLITTTWLMFNNAWALLPVIGILGVLAKETFMPITGIFVFLYWIVDKKGNWFSDKSWLYVFIMMISMTLTVIIVQSIISGSLVLPSDIVAKERGQHNILKGILDIVLSKNVFYAFIWLAPLGVLNLKYFPQSWVISSIGAACMSILLGAYHNAGNASSRAIFHAIGPILSLSAAYFLVTYFDDSQDAAGHIHPSRRG